MQIWELSGLSYSVLVYCFLLYTFLSLNGLGPLLSYTVMKKHVLFLCFPSSYLHSLKMTFFYHWLGTDEAQKLGSGGVPALSAYSSKAIFW